MPPAPTGYVPAAQIDSLDPRAKISLCETRSSEHVRALSPHAGSRADRDCIPPLSVLPSRRRGPSALTRRRAYICRLRRAPWPVQASTSASVCLRRYRPDPAAHLGTPTRRVLWSTLPRRPLPSPPSLAHLLSGHAIGSSRGCPAAGQRAHHRRCQLGGGDGTCVEGVAHTLPSGVVAM